MLQLLNPIWLFGIGGILIPLIIHLWNIKTGRTLKIGSITLMGESSRQNSRSLKLMEMLLLFLRCLLIILLSFLLAEPVWRSMRTAEENKGWILIERSAFNETYANFKIEIDSLSRAGIELHLFEAGFEEVELEEMLAETEMADTTAKLSFWSLISLMEQQIPKGSKAFVFTNNRANRFKGNRPATKIDINWKTFTPSDSTSKWINHAYLTSSGNIRALVSESNPRGTVVRAKDIIPGNEISGLSASIMNGKPQVKLNDQTVISDTSTLNIAINADGFLNDAEYLRAAIDAIQKYTLRKIKFVEPSSQPDILFWLSSKNLPTGIKPGSIVFQYARGKTVSTPTWLTIPAGTIDITIDQIPFHKRVSYPENNSAFPIWEDGFGIPLLNLTQSDNISLYTFYSRLNPEWTDLVWNPEFVKLIMPLILPDKPDALKSVFDKRSIAHNQLLPNSDIRPQTSKNFLSNTRNLQHYFWLILIALFITERYLSFRNSII
jgi:hypothetical protein